MSPNNKGWANATKSAVASSPTSQLKRVGTGLEPISIFYQYNPPKEGAPETAKQLAKDSEIMGKYEGTLVTKKFSTTYYKVRTQSGLVAIPSTGQLKSLMSKVADGSEVQIIYRGTEKLERGQYAGKAVHTFIVNASDLLEG